MTLISIIVPIYNVEAYIEKIIISILKQTYTEFELLLIDDGSTDQSGEIARAFVNQDERVHYYRKENGGLSDARNYGMQYATGEWINFIDGDDEVTSTYLAHLVEAKERGTQIAVARFFNIQEDEHVDEVTPPQYSGEISVQDTDAALKTVLSQKKYEVSAWAKLYDRELFKDIQYPVGKLYEDFYTTVQLIDHSKQVAFIDVADYAYRLRQSSISAGTFSAKKMDGVELSEAMINYVKAHRPKELSFAYARAFSTLASLLLQMPAENTTFAQQEQKIWSLMESYRYHFLFNFQLRFKTLFAAWTTFLGKRAFKKLGQHNVNRK
ncbi:glycosyltransferase family 2 protein [Weissella viridescens]|uniref:Glycosyltransferase family 2 protein n=1 Tax=Weissella viridescens TaxID=1629 RepID=A0A3P2RFH7_WEIVI|nr:glycosyltransferase family 2 protein [Weissella viridescens]RRG17560.1 glycosyltransferase family 2 protein [Weissella viridescens]